MLFLTPSQQCQSTEGTYIGLKYQSLTFTRRKCLILYYTLSLTGEADVRGWGRGKCPVTSKTHDDKRRSWVSAADIQAATVGLYTHARLGRTSLRDASKSRTARTELTVRDRPANESSVTLTLK